MGAVLAQVQDGKERAMCYASKAFSKSQTKYSAKKRELLAIVTFTRHLKHYLLGKKFKIVTIIVHCSGYIILKIQMD